MGADHPVWALGVSAYGQHVTSDVLSAALAGQALGVVPAHTAGLAAFVVDAGVGGQPVAGSISVRPRRPRGELRIDSLRDLIDSFDERSALSRT